MTDDTLGSLLLLAAEQDLMTQLTSDDINCSSREVTSVVEVAFTVLVLVLFKSHYCFSTSSLSNSQNSAFYFSSI